MSIHQPQFGPENTRKIESNAEITSQILAEATTIQIRPEDRNRNGQLLVFPGGPVSLSFNFQTKFFKNNFK
jgi:hypothetical protein